MAITDSIAALTAAPAPGWTRAEFPALHDPRYPVHRIAHRLEPFLRVIVENILPEKIILFGSYAYGQPTEHIIFPMPPFPLFRLNRMRS